LGLAIPARAAGGPRRRAVVIGHTARGNFGHGLDQVFNHRADVEVLAVADPDPVGRERARGRAGAARGYADYREMIERERPELVSVAPRWTDQHHAMVGAALAAGAHVYCEKPFTRTLAEADDLLALAARSGRRIAVAHQGRLSPATLLLKERLDDGLLGELLEIRLHGKQDQRAGGEDLLVLGTHQFDLVRFFAGDPLWCTARILERGREALLADARPATEGIGPIRGDEIEAYFALPRGVGVHYSSRRRNPAAAGPWGMELIGTKGRARLLNDVHTQVFVLRAGPLTTAGQTREWVPLAPGTNVTAEAAGGQVTANRRVVDDWIAAIAEGREPVCSGFAAMKSLEMIHAVFAAGVARTRVALPLTLRAHPLAAS
ncbi:MAG: Gfo/Idh/MocA family oxidoreductase, partial [Verrucomicrobia bacterium]|nr:Gfo/Idh/MocA family oxidoreductase [Verrucomicrobiota bacterium]